ncbi:D-cysteine desulfhydrase family protein [Bowmanella sp. Y26]|uniref:D-cysteine desulfhydrase family protein n=1 Tax=Bowmanella yangjiangensis TaxID=2811230 RepID=UPI001BDCAAE0|nr:D-cysteine desulfhydrase family protein [Bowmanella yangjiangensis]MBT1063483.1 D-cysteine desulfhydrase family protein [Bowmanella yangjiangensis]
MSLDNRIELATLPTPLEFLEQLSTKLGGPQIWLKRDDLTGLALGGNKTRKLEYILFDAIEQGADCIITAGAIQSNHCRQTAAAAAKLGLECHLVLGGEAPEKCNGNLLLDNLLGAHIHWAGENRKGEGIPALIAELKAKGKTPYMVPYGGSNLLGALGYANAVLELVKQSESRFTHVVFASASGGTHAGILAGARLVGLDSQILGIRIDKADTPELLFADKVLNLANETAEALALEPFNAKDVLLNEDYLGGGYAVIGDAERQAIDLLAKTEGVLVDPVYTGRAMAGLLDLIQKGYFSADDKVLFWHTGGAPALFAYANEL